MRIIRVQSTKGFFIKDESKMIYLRYNKSIEDFFGPL